MPNSSKSSRARSGAAVAVALIAAVLAGCLAEPPAGRGTNPTLTTTTVVAGLDHPWDLAFPPAPNDSWMLYTERGGKVSAKQLPNGAPVVLGQLGTGLAGTAGFVVTGEGGLLGLAVDPEFTTNHYVYACYDTTTDVRLARFTVNSFAPGALQHNSDIVTGIPVNPSGRHSGCRPRFRPSSNPPQLFIGTGDSATDGTIPQNLQSLGGKVLCVDRNGAACAGNPGIGDPAIDDRIFSWGHRNVQGIAFNPDGSGWSVEHGTDRDDEINVLIPADFGWNPVSGPASTAYDESQPMTRPGALGPSWASASPTTAPSGATVLWGPQWKGWHRAVAVAMLKKQELYIIYMDDFLGLSNLGLTVAIGDRGRLRSAVEGPDGNLYISTDNGSMNDQILKVVPS
ncbi:MAG TPA: PQQ-dependent sugar dehydrogenase [Acidimicrobiia bacterium]|nr:PQQ-dependent sugar dehydrogenase [Acidimicrobiia bacterium]